jgi:hypothetical protein
MTSPYKFGHLDFSGEEVPFQYGNHWAVERTTGPSRLVIAPASNQIALITRLATVMRAPFEVLYVLLVPRGGGKSGRYQAPKPIDFGEVELFLWQFQELFESDARQHVWVGSADNSSLLVYDNHNVIYAYGPLEEFERILASAGLARCEDVRFPKPHTHRYNFEFDQQAESVLKYWEWVHSPLQESDDL